MTNYKNLNFDIASPVIKSDILDFDFAAGEDLALSSWTGLFGFYINSIDYTDKVIGNSLKIGDFLTNRIDTATFTAVCALADAPAEGQEVSILISGDRVFGGYITKANRKRLNTTILKIDCQARDFSILLLNKLVAEAYTNQTAKYIIEDLINLYCGGFGINTSAVETGPTIASIKFNYISVYEAIKKIATQTGYEFYIDAAKVIHYYLTADNPAPFDIDDNSEIEDAEIEKDLESCVNSITALLVASVFAFVN